MGLARDGMGGTFIASLAALPRSHWGASLEGRFSRYGAAHSCRRMWCQNSKASPGRDRTGFAGLHPKVATLRSPHFTYGRALCFRPFGTRLMPCVNILDPPQARSTPKKVVFRTASMLPMRESQSGKLALEAGLVEGI